MAYGTPSDPVGGTVITVAYAVANILDPLRWLRLLTGNADPPGSNYVVVSTSTSGTQWQKITSDVIAAGAVAAHLGYTPAARTGDTFTGPVIVPAPFIVQALNTLGSGGRILLAGSGSSSSANIDNSIDFLQIYNPADPTKSLAFGLLTGGLTLSGAIQAASAAILGTIQAAAAAISGNASVAGTLGVTGAQTNLSTVVATQFGSSVATGSPPFTANSTTLCTNLNAAQVAGKTPTATPAAGALPLANGSGKLDDWITAGAVYAPLVGSLQMLGASSLTAANAAGWLLCNGQAVSRSTHSALFAAVGVQFGAGNGSTTFNVPDLRDRFPVGVSGTKTQGATGGAATVDLTHAHSGAALGISGSTGAASGGREDLTTTGGTAFFNDETHTHDQGTLDVTGSTSDQTGQTAVSIQNPYQAVNFIIYSGVAT